MVLSLKNKPLTTSIEPIADEAKVTKQAETLGWPILLIGEALNKAIAHALEKICQELAQKLYYNS
jgi:hypothetical protein